MRRAQCTQQRKSSGALMLTHNFHFPVRMSQAQKRQQIACAVAVKSSSSPREHVGTSILIITAIEATIRVKSYRTWLGC